MNNTLYHAIKAIPVHELEAEDMAELLLVFLNTQSNLIRNQLAFMFAEANYSDAIPHIIAKIKDAQLYHANGSLVFALTDMDTLPYFVEMVSIACTQGYEARLAALDIIQKDLPATSGEDQAAALAVIAGIRRSRPLQDTEPEENGPLHFMQEIETLIHRYDKREMAEQ